MPQTTTIPAQFAFSLNRAMDFAVDRLWIDFILLVTATYLPQRMKGNVGFELSYVIAATLILFGLREYFLRSYYDDDANAETLERTHQMLFKPRSK